MYRLLAGSTNPRKIDTYKRVFQDERFELVTPKEAGIEGIPEETGRTLEENAVLKAKYYAEAGQMPSVADDAGFEIPALDNFPGVRSRRFAGHEMSDQEVIDGILKAMKDLQGGERRARIRVVLALAFPDGRIYSESDSIEGVVPERPYEKRMEHFPYRSLLYIDSLQKWFYDLTDKEEVEMGYRISSAKKMKNFLT